MNAPEESPNLMRFVHALESAQAIRSNFMESNGLKFDDSGALVSESGQIGPEEMQLIANFMSQADDAAIDIAEQQREPTEQAVRDELRHRQQLSALGKDLSEAKSDHARAAIQRHIDKWQSSRPEREESQRRADAIAELRALSENASERGDKEAQQAYLEEAINLENKGATKSPEEPEQEPLDGLIPQNPAAVEVPHNQGELQEQNVDGEGAHGDIV